MEDENEDCLVNQDDIYSPTYKQVRESMSKNGYSWEEALFFLTEDKKIALGNPQLSVEEIEVERCPRCGELLFAGDCVICD